MKKTASEFFASLQWDYSGNIIRFPVFSSAEIKELPLRWLKLRLLEEVGLTTRLEISNSIFRFKARKSQELMTEWPSLFTKLTSLYGQVSVNMKIVSLKKTGNLPSFQILSSKDIKAALDFAEHHISHANEIWWCLLSTAETEEEAYSGRVTFHHNKLALQILEVVWDKDTRAIDKYYKQKAPYQFVRASKWHWELQFKITDAAYSITIFQEQQLQSLTKFIYLRREAIEQLQAILYGAGANELCLDFIKRGKKLTFIDWDTGIETALTK